MTEEQLQDAVIELAQLLGYLVAHFRPALTARGWRTPVQGNGRGFPDLVLVRPGRVIYAELKAHAGTVSPDQQVWLDRLRGGGAEVYLWRPRHWLSGEIEATLRATVRGA